MMVRTLVVALALLFAAPASALACPVCGLAGPGNNGWAYLAMTLMLSALPVGILGGVLFWVYRRTKEAEEAAEAEQSRRASAAPTRRQAGVEAVR
jgi:Na+/melibiose symporter-like transporter